MCPLLSNKSINYIESASLRTLSLLLDIFYLPIINLHPLQKLLPIAIFRLVLNNIEFATDHAKHDKLKKRV